MFGVAIGLFILILINIILGTLMSVLQTQGGQVKFRLDVFLQGALKGAVVMLCFGATYIAGSFAPNLAIIQVGENTTTLIDALGILLVGGYGWYGLQVIQKLQGVLKLHQAEQSIQQDNEEEQ